MVTDQQVRRLFKLVQTEKNFGTATIKAGMDEKTGCKYRRLGKLPSELETAHTWRWEDVYLNLKVDIKSSKDSRPSSIWKKLKLCFKRWISCGILMNWPN